MRLRHALTAALAACALAAPARAQLAAFAPPPEAGGALRFASTADSIVRRVMREQGIPGISVAIVKDGQMVLQGGWGITRDRGLPATASTEYQIASVTKQFTAAAILLLADEGKLRLDEPVTTYVSGLSPSYHEVTLGELLNHTAGVPNFTEFFRRFRQPLAPAQLVDSLARRPLLFEPGTGFHYSNSGYYLLGLVIERVTKQPYAAYLHDRFWVPLGMADTRYCGAGQAPVPAGYGRNGNGQKVEMAPWSPTVLFAAGSICSTAADLAKWTVALGEGRVLGPDSYRLMTSPAASPDPHLRMSYGFGMMVDTTDAGPYLHHDGAIPGFRSQVAWYPEEHLAVVVLMNQGLATPEPIERELTRAVLGMTPPAPRLADQRPASVVRASGADPWPWREP